MSDTSPRLPWRRAAVTGGAGFLGSHLCERLLDSGVEVDCVDNLLSGSRKNIAHLEDRPGFRFVECDVSAPDCQTALSGPYVLVLHFACCASPADYLRLPLETLDAGSLGTRALLAVAERDGARFLLASTSEVYGDPLVHPQREDYWGNVNPVGPRSVYDESKRFAEALVTAHVRARDADAGIVRLFNSYGPRMRAHDGRAVPTFVCQALAGEPLTVAGDGSQTRSLCYVDDTVDGVLLVAGSHSVRPVNIGGTDEVTVAEIARRVVALTGSSSRIEFVDRPVDDPRRRRPDTALARELLGWEPKVPWEEGIKQTIAYFAATRPAGEPAPPTR
jgi:dTDP-glucose 4,6-dehydratase